MEWLLWPVIGLVLLVMAAPLVMLLGTLFILVPLAHLAPLAPSVSRTSFQCPFSRRRVSVAFVTPAGAGRPSEVETCSLFAGGPVRCKKECLGMAATAWAPSPMAPRYALVAGDVAWR